MMNDDNFKLLKGFALRRTDICNCGVAFATDNPKMGYLKNILGPKNN